MSPRTNRVSGPSSCRFLNKICSGQTNSSSTTVKMTVALPIQLAWFARMNQRLRCARIWTGASVSSAFLFLSHPTSWCVVGHRCTPLGGHRPSPAGASRRDRPGCGRHWPVTSSGTPRGPLRPPALPLFPFPRGRPSAAASRRATSDRRASVRADSVLSQTVFCSRSVLLWCARWQLADIDGMCRHDNCWKGEGWMGIWWMRIFV